MLILDKFFEYIYHIGCAINLHSITNSGLIPGGQNLGRERQTVLFFTAVNPMDTEHKDPYKLDLTKPRLAWYKQKTWKRHQDVETVFRTIISVNQLNIYGAVSDFCVKNAKLAMLEQGDLLWQDNLTHCLCQV